MRQNPRAVRVEDLDGVLLGLGFTKRRGAGDHVVYAHPHLVESLAIDTGRQPVKAVYIQKALALIDQLAKEEDA